MSLVPPKHSRQRPGALLRAPIRALVPALLILGCHPGEGGTHQSYSLAPHFSAGRSLIDGLVVAAPGANPDLGEGWYGSEGPEGARYAWARGERSTFRLFRLDSRAETLQLEVQPAPFLETQALEVRFNGESLGERLLERGWQSLRWAVPIGAQRRGTNRVEVIAARWGSPLEHGKEGDARQLSFALRRAWLGPQAPTSPPGSEGLAAGEVLHTAHHVGPGAELTLELSSPSRAAVRLLAFDPAGGPALHDRRIDLPGGLQRTTLDLSAAEGEELHLALVGLEGSVELEAARGVQARALRPVIVMVVDTLRADHVLEHDGLTATPNLARLERDGVRFPRAFSHAATTLPSHTALFSSRLPNQSGVVRNGSPVPKELPLFAAWLARFGYRTEAVISMGTLMPVALGAGLDRGFHRFDDDLAADMSATWATERALGVVRELAAERTPFFLFLHYADPHVPYRSHGRVVRRARLRLGDELLDEVSTAEVVLWERTLALPPGRSVLSIEGDERFKVASFLALGPDGPLEAEFELGAVGAPTLEARIALENPGDAPLSVEVQTWLYDLPTNEEARERYASEVDFADRSIGLFLDELERLGLYEEALIVFTSDHGEGLGDHGAGGHGMNLFDEQIRVPLIVKPPASEGAQLAELRARREQVVRHIDVVPTALDLLALPPLPGQVGASLFERSERLLMAETHYRHVPVQYALRDERWKLIFAPEPDVFALFDLVADPGELTDVLAEEGEALEGWQALLRGVVERDDRPDADWELDPSMQRMLEGLGY